MVLWTVLILLDSELLTNSDASINGEHATQLHQTSLWASSWLGG